MIIEEIGGYTFGRGQLTGTYLTGPLAGQTIYFGDVEVERSFTPGDEFKRYSATSGDKLLAYQRWLDEADIRQDGLNARLYFWANSIIHEAIAKGEPDPPIFPITLRELNDNIADVVFIDENHSYEVGGIEHSQHGHIGPNGSRGSPNSLKLVADKLTTGHTHSPFQSEGLVTGGVCNLDMGYNRGPTGWAIAHVIGHHDGARQIIFMDQERFAA